MKKTPKPEVAINTKAYTKALELLQCTHKMVLNAYVNNKMLVLQLPTCTFRVPNN